MSSITKARAAFAVERAENKHKKVEASWLGVAAKKARCELATVDPIPPATPAEAPAAAAPDAAPAPAADSASTPREQNPTNILSAEKTRRRPLRDLTNTKPVLDDAEDCTGPDRVTPPQFRAVHRPCAPVSPHFFSFFCVP